MFGFRKLAYTLLSRHFWVGIGVGFSLAGLLSVNLAQAQVVVGSEIHGSAFSSPFAIRAYNVTGSFWSHACSSSNSWCGEITVSSLDYEINDLNRSASSYVFFVTDDTPVSPWGNFLSLTLLGASTSTATQYYFYAEINSNGEYTCVGLNSLTECTVIIEPTPLLNFSFTGGNIASTSCVGSSTSSICTHYYYPNFTPVTPVNLFVLFITFLVSFAGTGYIIRKLT